MKFRIFSGMNLKKDFAQVQMNLMLQYYAITKYLSSQYK